MNKIDVYNIMSKIKGGEVNKMNIMSTSIRYGILFILLCISIYYIEDTNIQLIMFIILLIVMVIGGAFLIKDLTGLNVNANNSAPLSIESNNPIFFYLFSFTIGIGVMSTIICVIFFLVVLTYGRKELKFTDKSITKQMSSYNNNLLTKYIKFFIYLMIMIILLSFLIFISFCKPEMQNILKNILCISLSLGILGITGLELYYAIMFLKIQEKKGLLYEITTKIETTI